MHVLLGYLLCLVVVTPAISIDVFFALIGATSRLHDLLGIVRSVSRMLQSVTSPFKIALSIAVLLAVFASGSSRSIRGIILVGVSAAGIAGLLQTATLHAFDGVGFLLVISLWALATSLTFAGGSRLLAPARN